MPAKKDTSLAAKEKKYPILRHLSPNTKELFLEQVEPNLEHIRIKDLYEKYKERQQRYQHEVDERKKKIRKIEAELLKVKQSSDKHELVSGRLQNNRRILADDEGLAARATTGMKNWKPALDKEEKANPFTSLFDPLIITTDGDSKLPPPEGSASSSGSSSSSSSAAAVLSSSASSSVQRSVFASSTKKACVESTAASAVLPSPFVQHLLSSNRDLLSYMLEFLPTWASLSLGNANKDADQAVNASLTRLQALERPLPSTINFGDRYPLVTKVDLRCQYEFAIVSQSLRVIASFSHRITELRLSSTDFGSQGIPLLVDAFYATNWPTLKILALHDRYLLTAILSKASATPGFLSSVQEIHGNVFAPYLTQAVAQAIKQGVFPSLRKITVKCGYHDRLSVCLDQSTAWDSMKVILQHAKEIDRLEVVACHEGDGRLPRDFAGTFQQTKIFSNLRTLRLNLSANYRECLSLICSSPAPLPFLENFEISRPVQEDGALAVPLDLAPGSLPSLSSLSIRCPVVCEENYKALFLACGPNLRRLSFGCMSEDTHHTLLSVLSTDTQIYAWRDGLTHLTIDMHTHDHEWDQEALLLTFKNLFLAFPALQSLTTPLDAAGVLAGLIEAKEAGGLTNFQKLHVTYRRWRSSAAFSSDVTVLLLAAWMKKHLAGEGGGGGGGGLANFEVTGLHVDKAILVRMINNIGLSMLYVEKN